STKQRIREVNEDPCRNPGQCPHRCLPRRTFSALWRWILCGGRSEVFAAQKMFENLRAGGFVKRDAVAPRQDERRARAHRDLEPPYVLQSAFLRLGRSLTRCVDKIEVDCACAMQ